MDVFDSVNDRPIYLYNLFWACTEDLCSSYRIDDKICGIIDDKVYMRYRSVVINDKIVPIMDSVSLIQLPDNAIMIVMGGDYEHDIKKLCNDKELEEKFEVIYYWPNKEGRNAQFYYNKYKFEGKRNVIVFRNGIPIKSL